MKLEIIQSGDNKYKIISKSNAKHPALEHLASLLKESNKHSDIKVGIYSITGGEFCSYKRVYSYISKRTDKFTKSKFYQFLRGHRQLKPHPSSLEAWTNSSESKNVLDFLQK